MTETVKVLVRCNGVEEIVVIPKDKVMMIVEKLCPKHDDVKCSEVKNKVEVDLVCVALRLS